MKPVEWLGSSKADVRAFPEDARTDAGWQLELVQRGDDPDDWKPMKTVGQGVREIRISVGSVPGDLSGDAGRPGSGASCVPEKDAGNGKERPRTRGAKVETMEGGAMTSEIYENVWDALADTEQEAANLKLRSSLLYEIRKVLQGWNVSQDEAGKRLGLTRPRTNDLLTRQARQVLPAMPLVSIAASAHLHVETTPRSKRPARRA
jgi:predicted XRE-type DNA-binding protein